MHPHHTTMARPGPFAQPSPPRAPASSTGTFSNWHGPPAGPSGWEAHSYLLSSGTPPALGAASPGTLLPTQPCLHPTPFLVP